MSIPGSGPLAASPYGAVPVIQVIGPEGGPYDVAAPKPLVILPSASRTATTTSATQSAPGFRGLLVTLRVTVNPGGAETLLLAVIGTDPRSGWSDTIVSAPASATPDGMVQIYPGGGDGATFGAKGRAGLHLPLEWYVLVVHSGAGAWTYTVSAELLP